MSERNGSSSLPARSVSANTAEFLGDVMTLVELQGKLFVADAQDSLHKLLAPVGLLLAGAVLMLATLPIVLMAASLILVETTSLSQAQAFSITAFVGLALSAGACLIASRYLRRGLANFERSLSEWNQNISWVKRVMNHLGRSSVTRRDSHFPVGQEHTF